MTRLPVILSCARSLMVAIGVAGACLPASAAEQVSFNAGWRFSTDPTPPGTGPLAYTALKPWLLSTIGDLADPLAPTPVRPAGEPPGADTVAFLGRDFDDSAWRQLDLPHDWGIERPFEYANPANSGKIAWWGVGWYRKHFRLPDSAAGQRVYLDVDGAMAYASIWVNGRLAGGWPFGYASFRVDLTPFLDFGDDNVIAIRLDNPPDSSRWYAGGGIYRNVWLVTAPLVHIAHWGVQITTPRVTADSADIYVATTIENTSASGGSTPTVSTEVYALDATGERIGPVLARHEPSKVSYPLAVGESANVAQNTSLPSPRLWSVDSPARYVAVTRLMLGGDVIDTAETPFGIRTIAFDSTRGFLLNGAPTKVQGVCLHHDQGALGTAIHVRALERQLQILREMGCNAVRTSHNPPAPEFLELCDRMGFLVMDEAFDAWAIHKKVNDYSVLFPDWHEADLRALVRRDRNHPSVILWSIGNEIFELRHAGGWRTATQLAAIMRAEDRTRPITAGLNRTNAPDAGFGVALDVIGINYHPGEYADLRGKHPHLPFIGSETSSCISSRGEYFFPVEEDKAKGRANFHISSYDLYGPRWAGPPDETFRELERNPAMAGEFVWTGFDYLGEPTPYGNDPTDLANFSDPAEAAKMEKEMREFGRIRSPARSSYFGILDLCGFPKDRYYLYQSHWRPDLPMAHILPHWTWPDRFGQVTPVHVYTSGDEAELFLNGRSLGRKRLAPLEYRLRWDDVVYEPGTLKVVAYKNGARWAESERRTAGPAAGVTLAADRSELTADGRDLAYVTVTIVDRDGIVVPRAKNLVRVEVSGPAEIAAVDNGDPTSFLPFQASERPAFNGLALVILRTRTGAPGAIRLTARADGLAPAEVNLNAR